jgi:hypothetical protein
MSKGPLTLSTICGGMVEHIFNRELSRVCENIADPSVKTEAVRKVAVVVTIKPNPKGTVAEISYDVKTSMPGVQTEKTSAYLAMDGESKKLGLFDIDTRQTELPLMGTVDEIRPVGQSVQSNKPVAFTPAQKNTNN